MSFIPTERRGQLVSVTVAIAAVALLVSLFTGVIGGSKQHTIVVQTADALSLNKGNTVHIDGVTAGTIQKIGLKGNYAYLTLNMGQGYWPIHNDASATIRPVSLLGEDYVDLQSGTPSAPLMPDGGMITAAHTTTAVNLQNVLNGLNDPTTTGLVMLTTAFGQGMAGNGANAADAFRALAPALDNTTALSNLLDTQNQTLTALLDHVTPVLGALDTNHGQTLDHLVGDATTLLSATATRSQALGTDLQELPGFLSAATNSFNQLGYLDDQTTPALASLRPLTDNLPAVSNELLNFTAAADPATRDTQPVLAQAKNLIDQTGPVVSALLKAGPAMQPDAQALDQTIPQGITGTCTPSYTDCTGLDGLFGFIRNWALSTSNYDGLSHYFRFYADLANSCLPTTISNVPVPQCPAVSATSTPAPAAKPAAAPPALPALPKLPALPPVPALPPLPALPPVPALPPLPPVPGAPAVTVPPPPSASGLTPAQEHNLLCFMTPGPGC